MGKKALWLAAVIAAAPFAAEASSVNVGIISSGSTFDDVTLTFGPPYFVISSDFAAIAQSPTPTLSFGSSFVISGASETAQAFSNLFTLDGFEFDVTSWTSNLTQGNPQIIAQGTLYDLAGNYSAGTGQATIAFNPLGGGAGIASVSMSVAGVEPVPLPAAAWLLISGLPTLGAFVRRRRSNTGTRAAEAISA